MQEKGKTYAPKKGYTGHWNCDQKDIVLCSPCMFQCKGSGRVYADEVELREHRNVCDELAYAEANAGEGDEGPEGVDVIQELIQNPEAMSELLGKFGEGLYHIHRAWQEPIYKVENMLLVGMASEVEDKAITNTLAINLLHGLVQQLTRKRVRKLRPVDVLREDANSDTPDMVTIRKAMGMPADIRGAAQEGRVHTKKIAVKVLVAKAETMGRKSRLSAASRITRQLETTLTNNRTFTI